VTCNGRGDYGGGHCCYVDGRECPLLVRVDDQPRCSLLIELGDWDAVHRDLRYLRLVKPAWERCGVSDCGLFGTGRDGKPLACCHREGERC
jgi:hypothetical protein